MGKVVGGEAVLEKILKIQHYTFKYSNQMFLLYYLPLGERESIFDIIGFCMLLVNFLILILKDAYFLETTQVSNNKKMNG